MRHGIRTRVWRELPFSARRAILSTLRTVDRIEAWLDETWRSLHRSPAWIFVAVVGTIGIVLTIILFGTLSRELLGAGSTGRHRQRPIIEPETAAASSAPLVDSRLCLAALPPTETTYAADFALANDGAWAHSPPAVASHPSTDASSERRTVEPSSRRNGQSVPHTADLAAMVALQPAVPPQLPALQPNVQFLRQRVPEAPTSGPDRTLGRSTAQVTKPVSEPAALSLSPHRPDGWSPSEARGPAASPSPIRYAGVGDDWSGRVVGARATDDDAWSNVGAWGPRADVGIRVELQAPQYALPLAPGRSAVVIRNVGTEMIHRLEVAEVLPSLEVVTAAQPDGRVQDQVVFREIQRLRSGRERTLSLEWTPTSLTERRHEARVTVEAFVAATVEVAAVPTIPPSSALSLTRQDEADLSPSTSDSRPAVPLVEEALPSPPGSSANEVAIPQQLPDDGEAPRPLRRRPAVECSIRGEHTVRSGELAELAIEVRNSGQVTLHGVRIWADLPPALQHRYGPQLECRIDRLAPGATQVAVLRVLAAQPGSADAVVRVVAEEPVETSAAMRLTILKADAARERLQHIESAN